MSKLFYQAESWLPDFSMIWEPLDLVELPVEPRNQSSSASGLTLSYVVTLSLVVRSCKKFAATSTLASSLNVCDSAGSSRSTITAKHSRATTNRDGRALILASTA